MSVSKKMFVEQENMRILQEAVPQGIASCISRILFFYYGYPYFILRILRVWI